MVSELFRKVQDSYIQQRELGWRGKGVRQQPSTAASHFLQSLTELTTRLERYQHPDLLSCRPHQKLWNSAKAKVSLEGIRSHCVCLKSKPLWFVESVGLFKVMERNRRITIVVHNVLIW